MLLPLASVAAALGQDVTALALEGTAAYRGYTQRTPWSRSVEHLLEERLYAAVDSYLVERALAAWHVGFALDHTRTWGSGADAGILGYEYDARLDFWEDGTLPIELFAGRQIANSAVTGYPGFRTQSEVFGYSGALRPVSLPQIRSTGYVQNRDSWGGLGREQRRTSVIDGEVSHNDNRLVAVADVAYREDSELITAQERRLTDADVFANYHLEPTMWVTARGRARQHVSRVGGDVVGVENLQSSASLSWQPRDRLGGMSSVSANRASTGPGTFTADANLSQRLNYRFGDHLYLSSQGGLSQSQLETVDEQAVFVGEFANHRTGWIQDHRAGGYRLEHQVGVAALHELGVGWGAQSGTIGNGWAYFQVPGTPLQVTGGVSGGRQWDSSPRDLDYVSWGWEAGIHVLQSHGPSVLVALREDAIDQLSAEEGDSDRFALQSSMGWRLTRDLQLKYGLGAHRDLLDDEFSSGFTHTGSAGVALPASLHAGALYQYSVGNSSALSSLVSHRIDGSVEQQTGIVAVRGRVTWIHLQGRVPTSSEAVFWVEVSRRLGWAL